MTVGESNPFLDKMAATVAYKTVALRGWMQPVRYSPYPRNTNSLLEQFGAEKDGSYAGEGEVHVHACCPIPAPDHIKMPCMTSAGVGGWTSMSGTAVRDLSSEPSAQTAGEEPYVHAAVVACGGSDLVNVGEVDYVARRSGYDTEECVREAVEAGEIEAFHKSEDGRRQFDIYRVTPKGLKEHRRHMRRVWRRAEELAPWLRQVKAEFAAMDAEDERLRQSAGGDAAAQAGLAPAQAG